MSINPFDDDNGSFFVLVDDEDNAACGRPSPMFQRADGWFTGKRTGLRVWTTSNRTGPNTAQESAREAGRGPGVLIYVNRVGWSGRMELDDRTLSLTRGQLDIWLVQQTDRSGAEMLSTESSSVYGKRLKLFIRNLSKLAIVARSS